MLAVGENNKNRRKEFVKANFDDKRGKLIIATWNTTKSISQEREEEETIISSKFVMFLPTGSKEGRIRRGNTEQWMYAMSDENWLERWSDNSFGLPRGLGITY